MLTFIFGPPPNPLNPIMANVLEYFAMNGAAGATETGAVAGTVLSPVNNVGSSAASGPGGETTRDFERDSLQYLTVNQSPGGLFDLADQNRTFSVWCKPETDGLSMGLVSRYVASVTTRQYLSYRLSGNKASSLIMKPDNTTASKNSTGSSIVTGSWWLVWFWYDATNDQIGVAVNGDAGETAALAGGSLTTATDPFRVGWQTSNNMWDGLIGPITFYNKVLNQTERQYIYNGGAFRPFPYVGS